jgi:hypothetical protein
MSKQNLQHIHIYSFILIDEQLYATIHHKIHLIKIINEIVLK